MLISDGNKLIAMLEAICGEDAVKESDGVTEWAQVSWVTILKARALLAEVNARLRS